MERVWSLVRSEEPVAGSTPEAATHFPKRVEIIILIDIQLDSLFHISSLYRSRPPLHSDLSPEHIFVEGKRRIDNAREGMKSILLDVTDSSACNYCHKCTMAVLRGVEGQSVHLSGMQLRNRCKTLFQRGDKVV